MKKETRSTPSTKTYKETVHFIDSQALAIKEFQSLLQRILENRNNVSLHIRSLSGKGLEKKQATIEKLNKLKLHYRIINKDLHLIHSLSNADYRLMQKKFQKNFENANKEVITNYLFNK